MLKGVDIGGTFIKVLWEDGSREKHFIKDIKGNRERFLEKLRDIVLDKNPTGVGIAVAGFTSKTGKVFKSPNIPVLDGVELHELFKDSDVRIVVGNDVSVAAFGEWFFDNRDSEVLLLVAVGTGLGGGLVVGGEVFFGVCGSALEIGHHIIHSGGYPCSCGRHGCWEAYCSSYGLQRIYREYGGETLGDYVIVEKAKSGEAIALKTVEKFKEYLALGLMNMVHIFNPDRIILGGGLIDGMRELLEDIEEKVKELSEDLPSSCLSIRFSDAGEFLGARGALAFIKQHQSDIDS
ncbi:glucokinase [Hydrogenivirga caldilitoris]|uniref:Glucokinase n=1 Tax=Hydrogenivirga caldilitoris TaxID=246264 RepID=A0A497XU25_9AQUI|nr:ROK family protein [Hydrogenivirga caldilitoris]RLJ70642.1 glucokinase [Hydrogenivirga caldilitoris]